MNKLSKGLWQTEVELKTGDKAYFILEKIDKNNMSFWRKYVEWSGYIADSFRHISTDLLVKNNENAASSCKKHAALFDSEKNLENLFKQIELDPYKYVNIMCDLKDGTTGMANIAIQGNYVAYISRRPVVKKKTLPENEIDTKDFISVFSDIVISVGCYTSANVPTVLHYGIFKNPYYFLNRDQRYTKLGMQLHGFLSHCSLSLFKNKHYMITKPLVSMYQLIAKNIEKDHIHVGTIEEYEKFNLLSQEEVDNLASREKLLFDAMKLSPPRIALKGNWMSIMRQPSCHGNLRDFYTGGFSADFSYILVDLPALAACFTLKKIPSNSLTIAYDNVKNSVHPRIIESESIASTSKIKDCKV